MAASDLLEEFLVGLGVQIDVKEFFVAIDNMTKAVGKFMLGIGVMGSALKAALVATASALENLYYVAQRANTTVASLRELQYGMRQIGLTAQDANQALEGLASSLRINPGNENLLRYLGVQTRDANGAMRDTTGVMADFISRLSKMPYYVAVQYAEMFGINERTLYMLLHSMDSLGEKEAEWRRNARQVGVDLDGSAQKSRAFMNELRSVGEVIELMWLKVSDVLIGRLRPEIEHLKQFLLEHNKEITDFAIQIGTAMLDTADDIIKLLPEIDKLVKATIGWKVVLEAIADIVAYRIFGPIGFLASLLYQLYQKEQEMEKDDPGPAYDKEHKVDPDSGQTKQFYDNNNEMIDAFRRFLGHYIWPPLSPDYHKGGAVPDAAPKATPGAYRPSTDYNPIGAADLISSPGGIRRNNPGNLRSWRGGGYVGQAGGFAVFKSAMDGLVAMRDNFRTYYTKYGLDTVRGIISRASPPSENNTALYIRSIAKMLGVGPDDHLNMNDPATYAALMNGVTLMENGRNPYGQTMIDQAARAPIGGYPMGAGGNVTIQQKTDIHVHGSDPHSTGQEVHRGQEAVNAALVRSFRTAVLA